MSNLVVLTPSVLSANCLRKHMAKKLQSSFLPKFLPAQEMNVVGKNIIAMDKSRLVGYFANQLIIARLLTSAQEQTFSVNQAIDMSKAVIVLLHEFMRAGKEPRELEDLHLEHSAHLGRLSSFFQGVKDSWLAELSKHYLQDVTDEFLKNCLKLASLLADSNLSCHLLIAGSLTEMPDHLIQAVLNSNLNAILLPAAMQIRKGQFAKTLEFAKERGLSLHELEHNPMSKEPIIENRLFSTEIRELNFILSTCQAACSEEKSVLIVTEDLKFTRTLVKQLSYCGIRVANSIGLELSSSSGIRFLLLLAQLLNSESQLNDLTALFKHHYFKDEGLEEFERLVLEHNLPSNVPLLSLSAFLQKHCPRIWPHLESLLSASKEQEKDFSELIELHMRVAENLAPSIWNDCSSICDYLRELLVASKFLGKIPSISYKEVFVRLMLGRYSQAEEPFAKVFIIPAEETFFFEADLVLVPQFHDSNWPKTGDSDIWISDGIRASLGLSNVIERQIETQRSCFEHILCFPKVIFTRAHKSGGKETIESRFWPESRYFELVATKQDFQ